MLVVSEPCLFNTVANLETGKRPMPSLHSTKYFINHPYALLCYSVKTPVLAGVLRILTQCKCCRILHCSVILARWNWKKQQQTYKPALTLVTKLRKEGTFTPSVKSVKLAEKNRKTYYTRSSL